jgi:hypothetical protein
MIDIFRKYCKMKECEHKYGFMRTDENNKLFVETLKGDKITHLAYQHSSRHDPHFYYKYVDKLISISYATCGYTEKCQIGKPQQKCVDNKIYSPNKCAVVFAELLELENFNYNLNVNEFKALANEC